MEQADSDHRGGQRRIMVGRRGRDWAKSMDE